MVMSEGRAQYRGKVRHVCVVVVVVVVVCCGFCAQSALLLFLNWFWMFLLLYQMDVCLY